MTANLTFPVEDVDAVAAAAQANGGRPMFPKAVISTVGTLIGSSIRTSTL